MHILLLHSAIVQYPNVCMLPSLASAHLSRPSHYGPLQGILLGNILTPIVAPLAISHCLLVPLNFLEDISTGMSQSNGCNASLLVKCPQGPDPTHSKLSPSKGNLPPLHTAMQSVADKSCNQCCKSSSCQVCRGAIMEGCNGQNPERLIFQIPRIQHRFSICWKSSNTNGAVSCLHMPTLK